MMKNKKIIYIVIAVIILLAIDQITKIFVIEKNIDVIPNILKIEYQENIDGSFGVGQRGTFTFLVTNAVVIGIIIKFMKNQSDQIDKKTYCALIMVISGALGNVIDRIFRGHVIKFIKIMNFTPLNLSDLFIILGYVLLAVFFAVYAYKFKKDSTK